MLSGKLGVQNSLDEREGILKCGLNVGRGETASLGELGERGGRFSQGSEK